MNKAAFFLNKDSLSIHYEVVGRGPALMCLSGFGCSNYNFDFLREELSQIFTMVLIDNRGMGKSSPATSEYFIDDLAKDAILIMEREGFSSYYVMGISMGGFIAQKVALMVPHKILSLILCCTTSGGSDFPNLPRLDEKSIRKSEKLDPEIYNLMVVRASVFPLIEQENPVLFKKILDLRIAHTPDFSQVIFQQKAVNIFLNETIDLSSITCATFILSGSQDRFVSPDHAKILATKISRSSLKIIEEADHHFFLEKPKQTANAITEFIGSLQ